MKISRTIGRIIDLTVFAPIGLVSLVREHRPRASGPIDKQLAQNRQAILNRIQLAQLATRMAAERGRAAADPPVSRPQAAEGHDAVTQANVAAVTVLSANELPISDYESLAAIHVVHRLGTLRPDELEQVRSFEHATRGRRTVLAKIEQLQDAAGA